MNSREREGLIEILRSLNIKDLLAIVDTTTKHMVKAESVEEAIQIILNYSENAATLLRRKKIKKQTLFTYLRSHNVIASINGEKIDYIRACIQLWNSDTDNKVSVKEDPDEPGKSQTEAKSSQVLLTSISPEEVTQLGIQFSNWFFENLNTLRDFGPQHFWPDCKLWLHLKIPRSKDEKFCIMGAENVSMYLISYIIDKKFFFKPNINTDSIRSDQEQHGLVSVCTSGVVHQVTNCIGLFDINFGLVSDPLSCYTWKIKLLCLVLHINDSVPQISDEACVPSLCSSSDIAA